MNELTNRVRDGNGPGEARGEGRFWPAGVTRAVGGRDAGFLASRLIRAAQWEEGEGERRVKGKRKRERMGRQNQE